MSADVSKPDSGSGSDELGKVGTELMEQVSRLRERVTHERRKLEGRSFSASSDEEEPQA